MSDDTFLNTPPTTIDPIGKSGWCFMFRDGGSESGALYLLPGKAPYYLRFRRITRAGDTAPVYETH